MLMKLDWKIIVDSADLITSERSSSEFIVRIEARKNEDDQWDVFKTYLSDSTLNYTEEYHAKTREEAKYIIGTLQKEKLLSKKELDLHRLQCAKNFSVRMKRQFKDYNVEKWHFAIGKDDYENFLYLRESDTIEVSVVMPEKFRHLEKPILSEVHAILGLDVGDFDVKQEVYYYTTRSSEDIKSKKMAGVFLGKMEMGFDLGEQE
jgi:hypothetical protein